MVNHVVASKSGSIVSYNISCYSSFLLLYYGKQTETYLQEMWLRGGGLFGLWILQTAHQSGGVWRMSHDTEPDCGRNHCRDCSILRLGVRQTMSAMHERRHKGVGRQDLPKMSRRDAAEGRRGILVLMEVQDNCHLLHHVFLWMTYTFVR